MTSQQSTSYEDWSRAGWRTHLGGAADAEDHLARLSDQSLPALAAAAAERAPGRVAVSVDGAALTHAELGEQAARVAGWLAGRVQPGDRVLLAAASSLGFVRCYLGALRAGAVVVLANPAYTAAELGHLAADSGAVLAFADAEPARRLAGLAQAPPTVDVTVLPDAGVRPGPGGDVLPGPQDTALLAYTSGTTGKPKGVPLTHGQLAVSIRSAMAAWRWQEDDVLVHALPLYHQHGLGGVHAALIAGGTAHVRSRFSPGDLVQAARLHRASVLFAVPTIYQASAGRRRARRLAGGPAGGRVRVRPAEPRPGRAAAQPARAPAAGQVRHNRERPGRVQSTRRPARRHGRRAAARRAGPDPAR